METLARHPALQLGQTEDGRRRARPGGEVTPEVTKMVLRLLIERPRCLVIASIALFASDYRVVQRPGGCLEQEGGDGRSWRAKSRSPAPQRLRPFRPRLSPARRPRHRRQKIQVGF